MSSRFGTSSLHQRIDPRNALFGNYQSTKSRIKTDHGANTQIPITSSSSGGYSLDNHRNFGHGGSSSRNGWVGREGGVSSDGFRAAIPNDRGQYSDAILSTLESQNDSEVEGIIGKVRQLKTMTIAIGDEIRESSALAEMMNDRFEGVQTRLRGTMSRMLIMAQKTGVGWKVWLAFFIAVILVFWYVRFFK